MEVRIMDDEGSVVIIEDQCYRYAQSGSGLIDDHTMWEDLADQEVVKLTDVVKLADELMASYAFEERGQPEPMIQYQQLGEEESHGIETVRQGYSMDSGEYRPGDQHSEDRYPMQGCNEGGPGTAGSDPDDGPPVGKHQPPPYEARQVL